MSLANDAEFQIFLDLEYDVDVINEVKSNRSTLSMIES